MSQSDPQLGAFFVDIVAPPRSELTFQRLTDLANHAFSLADQQAGLAHTVPPSVRNRNATILYPIGNSDVEPLPIKAILQQDAPALQIQQVVIDFEAKTAECEGQPNLAIEPEQIEYAREEIKPYLRDAWERKRARENERQLQEFTAWQDFLDLVEHNDMNPNESPSIDPDASFADKCCPLCETPTTSCTSCHAVMCLNGDCPVSRLIPFRSCSRHAPEVACLRCVEEATLVPPLGQCPDCNLWFCQFELTWCLGRPKDTSNQSPRDTFHRVPMGSREHPTKPVGCSSCTGGRDRPHCSNGRCWSRVGGYSSVCESCSPSGGLWCTCAQCWVCDDCKTSSTNNYFKTCTQCKRAYCIYECEYIQYCTECGRTTLCDDCVEEDWSSFVGPDAAEGVELKGACIAGRCLGKFCAVCMESRRCGGCSMTLCGGCMRFQRCDCCDGRFCSSCYRTSKRLCGRCDSESGEKT